MSNSESRHSQELGKGRTPKDLLEPKESALNGECVGIPKKPDTEEPADKNTSREPLQAKNDRLNPELVEFTNSTGTTDQPPEINTEELRHTDELHAHTDKLNEKISDIIKGSKQQKS